MAGTGSFPGKSSKHRVLIAGGGVAALEAMLALRELAGDRVEVEVLAPEPHFWYRPLAVAEPFGLGKAHPLELSELCDQAGAGFSLDRLVAVDHQYRRVRTHHAELAYDSLLVAVGAVPKESIPGAFTFGPADSGAYAHLLAELEQGAVHQVVFAMPGGQSWPLPLYELALLTAAFVESRQISDVTLCVVTPEEAPLALFGPAAGAALVEQLEAHGIALAAETYPGAYVEGRLELVPSGELAADRVVTLPRLTGPGIEALPQDSAGFIPTDESGRVQDVANVYAAGDATSFPIKQGGLAAQQALAAAQTIAAEAGAPVSPEPFRAVLRGLLLTGGLPKFMRADLANWGGDAFLLDSDPFGGLPPSSPAGI